MTERQKKARIKVLEALEAAGTATAEQLEELDRLTLDDDPSGPTVQGAAGTAQVGETVAQKYNVTLPTNGEFVGVGESIPLPTQQYEVTGLQKNADGTILWIKTKSDTPKQYAILTLRGEDGIDYTSPSFLFGGVGNCPTKLRVTSRKWKPVTGTHKGKIDPDTGTFVAHTDQLKYPGAAQDFAGNPIGYVSYGYTALV